MKGLQVGILGAGRSGLAAAKFLRRLGATVFLSESGRLDRSRIPQGVKVESGKHSSLLLDSELIIRSPGVPSHLPILKEAVRRGIPIWSELELASRYAKYKDLVAITGTNGKTTTTSLVGELFKAAGRRTFVVGNIGMPLSDVALKTTPQTAIIAEVSSYQLEDIEFFHPTISAILNITADHLEHHGTMRAYAAAKARIFENQISSDVCVLNADDASCRRLARLCPARIFWFSRKKKLRNGIYFASSGPSATFSLREKVPSPEGRGPAQARGEAKIVVNWNNHHFQFPLRTHLPGPHNVENILASVAMAVVGGIPVGSIRRVLKRFAGVEHRLEWVRAWRGARYINDSKATNVDSTRVALASFSQPLILIMGGEGKGSPYSPLKALIKSRVKRIILIGEDAPQIKKELKNTVPMEMLGTMAKAVGRAAQIAEPGDIVLLSPACASFDQYHNYEERGEHFKSLVRKLK